MPPKPKGTSERRSDILASVSNRTRLFALLALILEGLSLAASYSLPPAQRFPAFTISIAVFVLAFLIVFALEWRGPASSSSAARTDVVAMINQLVVKHKQHISPPTLAFLALAEYLSLPQSHGFRVANLNPQWKRDDDEWRKRAEMLEGFALLNKSGSDYARSELGSLYVFFALRDPQYREVLSLLKKDGWHLQFAT